MTVPIFAINLDHRVDRWQRLSRDLEAIGLSATRIAAVDKSTLADDPATVRMGVGHVACLRSHCKVWNAFLATSAPSALVLEDDAELHSDLPEVISCLDWWPLGHGIVRLEWITDRNWFGRPVGCVHCAGFQYKIRPILYRCVGSAGYLIDRTTAEKLAALVSSSDNAVMPVDLLLFQPYWSSIARRIRPTQLVPAIVRQRPVEVVGSDIGENGIDGQFGVKPKWAFRYRYKLRLLSRSVLAGQARKMRIPFGTGS